MVHFRQPDCVACVPQALERIIDADPGSVALWASLPRRRLAAGEMLLDAGASARHVWLVQRGLVRFCFLSADGLERNKSFHMEGAWIGGGMPPHEAPSPYSIQALEATELVELSYDALIDCTRRFPAIRPVLDEALSWTYARQATREAELLMLEPAARYQRFVQEQPQLAARLALHHIASFLGITNVALSRIRGRLGLRRGARSDPP